MIELDVRPKDRVVRRYRGVRIISYPVCLAMGAETLKQARSSWSRDVTPIGVNYPMTLTDAMATIDDLITQTMKCCKVDEREAVELLDVGDVSP